MTSKEGAAQGFAPSGANSIRPHAVITTSNPQQASFSYDPNGNMTTRMDLGVTYTRTWDALNRMASVTTLAKNTAWRYDADGQRVSKADGVGTTVYIGDAVEVQISGTLRLTTTYYFFGGARIAMQKAGALTYPPTSSGQVCMATGSARPRWRRTRAGRRSPSSAISQELPRAA